ncbi:MAG: GNAT family N-acetyltransferase [Clostridia bacterium]|nr:GNAT family N-acetyltransferase [Clostridia bacterium]
MHELLTRQLAADFCCTEADVLDPQHHFTVFTSHSDRRQYMEIRPCLLKIAVVRGKLLFTGREDIIARCRALYQNANAPWFMEAPNLAALNAELAAFGAQIKYRQPFYTAESILPVDTQDYVIARYAQEDIHQFKGDGRFEDAYGFCADAPDMLGVAALKDGEILGMAGASGDSPYLWQIGINVLEEARGQGIAAMLVSLLRNDVLAAGRLPFYGTSISHLESQRVALRSGFLPAWFELVAAPLPMEEQ